MTSNIFVADGNLTTIEEATVVKVLT